MATFTNVATLSYNGTVVYFKRNDRRDTADSCRNEAFPCNLTYKQGDTLTYIVNIVNTGNTAFTNLTLTDAISAVTPTVQEQYILWHTAEIYAIISTAHCRQLLP